MYQERPQMLEMGYFPDLRYYASSGSYTPAHEPYTDEYLFNQYWRCAGLRSTSISIPARYIGKETFYSTNRKRPLFNACTHHKYGAYNLPYTKAAGDQYFMYGDRGYYEWYWRHLFPAISPDIVLPKVSVPDMVRARAWWNVQPRFEGEVSLLNSIFELKDFRDILKHITSPEIAYFRFLTKYRGYRNDLRTLDLTRPAAEYHLFQSFALQPLLRDLAAMGAMVGTFASEAQKQFARSGLNTQKSHYSEVLYRDTKSLTTTTDNNFWFGYGKVSSAVFTATMSYRYSYEMRDTLMAFVHYWGLTGNAESFWNMIPWTFVFDYFNTMAKALHAMNTDRNVGLQMHQYCESLLIEQSKGYISVPSYDPGRKIYLLIDGKRRPYYSLISGFAGSSYNRILTDPYKGPAFPRLKWPSSAQAGNLLALGRCFL